MKNEFDFFILNFPLFSFGAHFTPTEKHRPFREHLISDVTNIHIRNFKYTLFYPARNLAHTTRHRTKHPNEKKGHNQKAETPPRAQRSAFFPNRVQKSGVKRSFRTRGFRRTTTAFDNIFSLSNCAIGSTRSKFADIIPAVQFLSDPRIRIPSRTKVRRTLRAPKPRRNMQIACRLIFG